MTAWIIMLHFFCPTMNQYADFPAYSFGIANNEIRMGACLRIHDDQDISGETIDCHLQSTQCVVLDSYIRFPL